MDPKAMAAGSLKSKTQWMGALVVILGVLQDQGQLLSQLIPPEFQGKALAALGLIFMILRAVTTTSLDEKVAPKEGGFASTKLLLVMAALAAGSFVLMGCTGTMPRAPKNALEQIEAVEITAQQASESIVNLTCTKYVATKCVEPGKAFGAAEGIALHDKVQDVRQGLKAATAIGAGQVGDCLGAKRTQTACIATARLLLNEVERKVLEAQAKGGSK